MNLYKMDLDSIFKLSDDQMEIMKIPKIELIDNRDELWTFIKLDRHAKFNKERKYLISSYGRIYNQLDEVMVESKKSSIHTKVGHYQCTDLKYDFKRYQYFLHRLILLSFTYPDKDRPFVNHIDGNPSHNVLWNLEWVNNSENIKHAVRLGLKKDKRGEQRTNAKWTDDEVRIICQLMEEGHKATFIYNALCDIIKDPKVQYERVRTLYKHIIHKTHWTHISKDYDIDFRPFNYIKEKGSVINATNRKNDSNVDNDESQPELIFDAKAKSKNIISTGEN